MRAFLLCLLALTGQAIASPWGLELGIVGGIGMARFAGDPTAAPPPSDPTNLFALFPPSATGSQGTGLAGSAGLSLSLTRKRRLSLGLELLASSQSLVFDEDLVFPSGTEIKRHTVWNWEGLRPAVTMAYAWPHQMGQGWALAPRLGTGLWYEKVTGRRKVVGAEGGPAQEKAWSDAPEDDWGWLAFIGMDWLRLGPGTGPGRIGLEARWRRGQALPDAEAGADKPVQTFEMVLTVPVELWVL